VDLYSENIMQFKGKTVRTYINHKLYGNQKVKLYNFRPLYTDNKIGFTIGEQEIFLYLNEIENMELSKNVLKITGKLQEIIIELI
jgi:hypothetical protein